MNEGCDISISFTDKKVRTRAAGNGIFVNIDRLQFLSNLWIDFGSDVWAVGGENALDHGEDQLRLDRNGR